MLQATRTIHIPEAELSEQFVRASGPGGQHVNRTASAVELRFDIAHSSALPEPVRQRLLQSKDRRITQDGVIVVQARRFRDQNRNRDDARRRLASLIADAARVPKKRVPTRPGRAARERRLRNKKQRGERKRSRSRNWRDE